jgi:alpha-ribazole phosphatase
MELIVWRHPKPQGVQGLCIGQVDVPVDRRKAKRLAHRIRHHARRQRLFEREQAVVWTSPLRRCFDVGRILRSWGWMHLVDERLSEMNFGDWDGQAWSQIAKHDIDVWCDNFAETKPGGGESVRQLLQRCGDFVTEQQSERISLLIGHAGWMNALVWLTDKPHTPPSAVDWPVVSRYGARKTWTLP